MLVIVGLKESTMPQLHPAQAGAALAPRERKPGAVRQAEVFLVWSERLQAYWCRAGFGAISVEPPPSQRKVRSWGSAGRARSQRWAPARTAGEAGGCTSWLSSAGLSSGWWGSRGAQPAVPALVLVLLCLIMGDERLGPWLGPSCFPSSVSLPPVSWSTS